MLGFDVRFPKLTSPFDVYPRILSLELLAEFFGLCSEKSFHMSKV